MTLLTELNKTVENIQLSEYQKVVLILIDVASTPKQAFSAIEGNSHLIASKDILISYNYVFQNMDELFLTDKGTESIISNDLVDNGNLTYSGQVAMKYVSNDLNTSSKFSFIKSLMD